jgi:hypothetical protein
MGVVYEAWDEKVERRIAIQCAKAGFRERLPPEVRQASDICHPNVCRIFEIHTASVGGEEFDFLAMEFQEGETCWSACAGPGRRGGGEDYSGGSSARDWRAPEPGDPRGPEEYQRNPDYRGRR